MTTSAWFYSVVFMPCHDVLLRTSDDGRLATRIKSDDHGSSDGGVFGPDMYCREHLAEVEASAETSYQYRQLEGKGRWDNGLITWCGRL